MSKTLLLFSGGLFSLAGLATLAMSMASGTSSGSATSLPPAPPDWHTPPQTRAGTLQRDAERTPGLEQRWSDADKRAATDPRLRLPELLDRLTARGHQPRIAYTWRALATQDDLVALKRSQVTFSFHNAVADGQPAALAADLFDARFGWGDNAHGSPKTEGALAFFRAVGEGAKALGEGLVSNKTLTSLKYAA